MRVNRIGPALMLLLGLMYVAIPAGVRAAEYSSPSALVQAAWRDLEGDSEASAARAALVLAKTPAETLALFRAQLRSVKTEPKRVAQLLKDLESDRFTEREAAQKELAYLGKCIKSDLQKALKGPGSAEAKKRIRKLLEPIERAEKKDGPAAAPIGPVRQIGITNVNGKTTIMINGVPFDPTPRIIKDPGPPRGWVRAARAVGVLEFLNTEESRRMLREMADGDADALPTKEAKAALSRLGK